MSEDLVERLTIKAQMIALGERIAWGSETALMHEAAERIAELEGWRTVALSNQAAAQSHCARVAELEAAVARLQAYGDPEFHVCAAAQWERATARAKREAEDWKRAAQEANTRAATNEATARSLRKKLDAALGVTTAE